MSKPIVLTSPMDGSPQVVRFDATTLWHLDAAEWAPSTASNPVLATTSADRQLIPRLRTEHCSAEVVSSVPGSEVPGDYRIGSPELHRIFAGDLRCRVTGLPLRMAAA